MDNLSQREHKKQISEDFQLGLISVIIPTFNRAHLITETMDSVLVQTYRPIEILVIDDGSTDNTAETVKNWRKDCQRNDWFELRYFYQHHKNASAARNFGISESRGEYIQFLDSDDLLCATKLQRQVEALKSAPSDSVAYGSWRAMYSRWPRYGLRIQKAASPSEDAMLRGYLSGCWYCPSHLYLFPRDVVIKIGAWDEGLLRAQDTDYLIRTLILGIQFIHVPGTMVFYRQHGSNRIGHEGHFRKHFTSILDALIKHYRLLEKQGKVDKYTDEFRSRLCKIEEDAIIREFSEGIWMCHSTFQMFGIRTDSQKYRLIHQSCLKIVRRYIVKPARKILGDWTVDCILSLLNKFLIICKEGSG